MLKDSTLNVEAGMMPAAMASILDTCKAAMAGRHDLMTALADIAALAEVELQVEGQLAAKAAAA
jgi:hypothetical protein